MLSLNRRRSRRDEATIIGNELFIEIRFVVSMGGIIALAKVNFMADWKWSLKGNKLAN